MLCYQQGVLSVLVLTPVFWPIKFEKLSGPTALPEPLKSFCIDYQQFYTSGELVNSYFVRQWAG